MLYDDGYIIFRNKVNYENVRCFFNKDGTIDYNSMEGFINNELMPSNFTWTKYRVSNKNNSIDASVFHRDLIPTKNSNLIETFTILTYLDTARMQIIPGSHRNMSMSTSESLRNINNMKTLELQPGDVMMFYSTLIHRGVFSDDTKQRRLIQVFECMDKNDFTDYKDKICHSKCSHTEYSDFMNFISKTPFIHILSFFEYMNSSSGYGNNTHDEYLFLSSEGLSERIDIDESDEINKYVIKPDLPLYENSDFKFKFYYKQYINILIIILLLLYVLKKLFKI